MRSRKEYRKGYKDYAKERFSVPAMLVFISIILALCYSVAVAIIDFISLR